MRVNRWPRSPPVAADVDGDAVQDFVTAEFSSDSVQWYQQGAGASFTERVISTDADAGISVFPVDLDGDADVDVVWAAQRDGKVAGSVQEGCDLEQTPSDAGRVVRK